MNAKKTILTSFATLAIMSAAVVTPVFATDSSSNSYGNYPDMYQQYSMPSYNHENGNNQSWYPTSNFEQSIKDTKVSYASAFNTQTMFNQQFQFESANVFTQFFQGLQGLQNMFGF